MDARPTGPTEKPEAAPSRTLSMRVPPEHLPATERRRGRGAHQPLEIGALGWFDIAVRVVRRVGIDNLGLITAGVTFYLFLAILPAMIAMATFYGISTDDVTLESHVAFLQGFLPDNAIAWLTIEMGRVSDMHEDGLTLAFALSLGLSFWAMNNAVLALFGAMNIAYGEVEKRSTIGLYLRAFAFTGTSLVVALVMVGFIVVMPLIVGSTQTGLSYGGRLVTAPILFILVTFGSAAIFRLGPSRKPARWRWIILGALFVASLWIASSTLLSWYLSNVADYSRLYGSLGTIVALMFWFFISVYILLLGAELNAEIEHQTMVDTTIGPPKPAGRRGAYVADTVGKTAAPLFG